MNRYKLFFIEDLTGNSRVLKGGQHLVRQVINPVVNRRTWKKIKFKYLL
jgi:hypothetical protein